MRFISYALSLIEITQKNWKTKVCANKEKCVQIDLSHVLWDPSLVHCHESGTELLWAWRLSQETRGVTPRTPCMGCQSVAANTQNHTSRVIWRQIHKNRLVLGAGGNWNTWTRCTTMGWTYRFRTHNHKPECMRLQCYWLSQRAAHVVGGFIQGGGFIRVPASAGQSHLCWALEQGS